MKLSVWQRIELWAWGHTHVRMEGAPRFNRPTKIYAAKCPEHGLYEDYMHGRNRRLICPVCGYFLETRPKF